MKVFTVWAVCVGWAVVENEGWLVTGAGCDVVIIDWALVIGGISVCVGCEVMAWAVGWAVVETVG